MLIIEQIFMSEKKKSRILSPSNFFLPVHGTGTVCVVKVFVLEFVEILPE